MSRLCVKNLPKHVKEDRLREFFSQKGDVTDAKLMRTKDGKSRQFAFIGFRTEREADDALKFFNNSYMDTFRITCKMVVIIIYTYLYWRFYLSLSGVESAIMKQAQMTRNNALEAAMASQSVVLLGLFMTLPMLMEIGLERFFRTALGAFIVMLMMLLQLCAVFFTFSLGTKSRYFGRTILHGGAKYRATGRGFVVRHEKFAENYRMYSRSHFVKGMELMLLLVVYQKYGAVATDAFSYVLITWSMWFLVTSWLFTPFLFNPSGFELHMVFDDWDDWTRWIRRRGGIGVPANRSWESWWKEEQEHLQYTGFLGRLWEVVLSLRFFLLQYGIAYHLKVSNGNKSIGVYGLSWLEMAAVMLVVKVVSICRKKFDADYEFWIRLLRLLLNVVIIVTMGILLTFFDTTVGDICASLLALVPTGWALLQISQACKPVMKALGLWGAVKVLAREYEDMMGHAIVTPIAALAWFTDFSELLTGLLFNLQRVRETHGARERWSREISIS